MAKVPRHPMAVAWDAFAARLPDLFIGPTGGVYLQNRLRMAFYEGWDACEQQAVAKDGRASGARKQPVGSSAGKQKTT